MTKPRGIYYCVAFLSTHFNEDHDAYRLKIKIREIYQEHNLIGKTKEGFLGLGEYKNIALESIKSATA